MRVGRQVFARDVGTASPYGKVKVSAVNVPVKMQDPDVDLTISPEDYIIADLNGVVLLKRELADKVIPMMAKRASIDSKIADALESGVSFTDAGQAYRNLGTT
jgi:regulator of RNase E activity RraA